LPWYMCLMPCRRSSTTHLKWSEMIWNDLKWSEIIWNDLKLSEIIWNDLKWSEMIWQLVWKIGCVWNDLKWSEMIWISTVCLKTFPCLSFDVLPRLDSSCTICFNDSLSRIWHHPQ
jgi:hypothetical protein